MKRMVQGVRRWMTGGDRRGATARQRCSVERLEDRNLMSGFAADWAEPDDASGQAVYLGRGGVVNWGGLNIHSAADVDWYKFRIDNTGTSSHSVGINFTHANGDLDIKLYDAAGNQLDASAGTADNERISLAGRAAGTYLLRVHGYAGATNTYSFALNGPSFSGGDFLEGNDTVSTAFRIPSIAGTTDPAFNMSGMSIHSGADKDWFKFELLDTGASNHYVQVNFTHASGDLDLKLYNASGTEIASSAGSADNERISLSGRARGTYYLQVYGYNGATNNYTFRGFGPVAPSTDFAEPNNTRAAAHDLGTVNGERVLSGLSVHNSTDVDWYKIQTTAAGTANHEVRIDFAHGRGDLDLQLYDAAGTVLTSSAGVSDREVVSLADRPAGVYYARVFGYNGASNSDYRLRVTAPAAAAADSFEANDTRAAASNLGTLQGESTTDNLSIHAANNDDWFRFTTVAPGAAGHAVRLAFDHDAGDLDLALFDAAGNALRDSDGTADTEEVSLAGLPAGTYYVRAYGYEGAVNPGYALTVSAPRAPAGDTFEANDTQATARDLGTVRGAVSYPDLSIHTATDRDWFRFTLVGSGAAGHHVRAAFQHAQGDLDLRLYDAAGTQLAVSQTNGDAEEISLAGRAAGTYFVQVYGYSGATNLDYDLSFQAPAGGGLQGDRLEANNSLAAATLLRTNPDDNTFRGAEDYEGLTITGGDHDYFKFTTGALGTAAHSVSIQFQHGDGDLQLELLDSSGQRIDISEGTDDIESISLEGLDPGTYYAHVSGAGAATGAYSLRLDTSASRITGSAVDDAWTIMVYITTSNLDAGIFQDINEMEAAVAALPGTVNVVVYWDQSALSTEGVQRYATDNGKQAAWGTAGRAVLRKDTNLNKIATRFTLLEEQNSADPATLTSFIQWAAQAAPAQKYALIMSNHGAGFGGSNLDNWDDSLNSDILTLPEIETALSNARPALLNARFGVLAFDACLMAMAEVGHTLRNHADVLVGSEEIIEGTGYDYLTAFDTLKRNPYRTTAEALATGMVQSYQNFYKPKRINADTLSATRMSDYTTLATALRNFTNLASSATGSDLTALRRARTAAITYNTSESVYRDLSSFMNSIDLGGASANLKSAARAVRDQVSRMVIKKTSDRRISGGLAIHLPPSGTAAAPEYSVLTAFNAATGWSTFLARLAGSTQSRSALQGTDWSEQNDVAALAADLHTLSGPGNAFSDLSIHDEGDVDWFRLALGATATTGHDVTVTPSDPAEVLQLAVYAEDGTTLLGQSNTGGGPQTVSLAGRAAGTYLIRVEGVGGESVSAYTLTVNAPGAAGGADWAGDNSTQAKAYDLGTALGNSMLAGLRVPAGGQDWFLFDTPRLPVSSTATLRLSVPGATAVSAQILDDGGNVVSSAAGTGSLTLVYPISGGAETYTLRVNGNATATAGYSLFFTTDVPAPPVSLPPPAPPAPPPPPPVQPVSAALVAKKVGKASKQMVRVSLSSGVTREIVSPFQKPQYAGIVATLYDQDGDGVMDSVLFTARRGKLKLRRVVSV